MHLTPRRALPNSAPRFLCVATLPAARAGPQAVATTVLLPTARSLLHDEHEEQLPVADLRTFDHQRAGLAQLGLGFEKHIFLLKQLQVEKITCVRLAFGIDVQ